MEGREDDGHRRKRPPRRAGFDRLPHAHVHGRSRSARDGPAQDEGSRRVHEHRGRLREEAARGHLADRRRLGPRAVDAPDAADEGAARPGHGRPSDLPPAAGRTHDGLQQPRAEAGRHRQEHARSAGRRHRARLGGQSDRRPEGRSDEPRLEGPPAPEEGRDRRGPQGGRRARREKRRDVRAGSAGRQAGPAGLGRDPKRRRPHRSRELPAVDHRLARRKEGTDDLPAGRLAESRRREGIHGRRPRRRDRRHVRGVLGRSGQHRQVRRRGHPALEDRGTHRRRRRRGSPGRSPRHRRQGDHGAARHL